jgi:ribosomal protein L24
MLAARIMDTTCIAACDPPVGTLIDQRTCRRTSEAAQGRYSVCAFTARFAHGRSQNQWSPTGAPGRRKYAVRRREARSWSTSLGRGGHITGWVETSDRRCPKTRSRALMMMCSRSAGDRSGRNRWVRGGWNLSRCGEFSLGQTSGSAGAVVKVQPDDEKVVFDGLSVAIRYLIRLPWQHQKQSRCDDKTEDTRVTSAHRSSSAEIKIVNVRIAYFSALIL